jgi:hypothetical protein
LFQVLQQVEEDQRINQLNADHVVLRDQRAAEDQQDRVMWATRSPPGWQR